MAKVDHHVAMPSLAAVVLAWQQLRGEGAARDHAVRPPAPPACRGDVSTSLVENVDNVSRARLVHRPRALRRTIAGIPSESTAQTTARPPRILKMERTACSYQEEQGAPLIKPRSTAATRCGHSVWSTTSVPSFIPGWRHRRLRAVNPQRAYVLAPRQQPLNLVTNLLFNTTLSPAFRVSCARSTCEVQLRHQYRRQAPSCLYERDHYYGRARRVQHFVRCGARARNWSSRRRCRRRAEAAASTSRGDQHAVEPGPEAAADLDPARGAGSNDQRRWVQTRRRVEGAARTIVAVNFAGARRRLPAQRHLTVRDRRLRPERPQLVEGSDRCEREPERERERRGADEGHRGPGRPPERRGRSHAVTGEQRGPSGENIAGRPA